MSIVVTCHCGQSFSAPDHLAGQTVGCPVCAQPILIAPANVMPVAPSPLVRPSVRRQASLLSEWRTVAACGAAGACLVVLLMFGLAAYRNFNTGGVQPTVVVSQPDGSGSSGVAPGGAVTMSTMPVIVAPVALPPAPPPRAGWQRVTLSGHSVELPVSQVMRDVADHQGEYRDLAWWPKDKPYTSATLCFTHIKTDRLTDQLPTRDMAYFHNTPNDFLAFEFQERRVQGFETKEYILRADKGPEYAWHQFVRIHDQEWVLVNGYARDGMTEADVDHFVQSLRISPTAKAATLVAETSGGLSLGSVLGGLSTAGWKSVSSRSGLCSVSMPQDATFKDDGPNNPQVVEEYRWPADCGPVGAWNQSAEYLIFRIHHDGHCKLENYPRVNYAGHEAHEIASTRGTVYQIERDIRVNGSLVVTLYARSAGKKLTRAQVDSFLNSLQMTGK